MTPSPPEPPRIEPIIWLLSGLMIFFTVMLFVAEKFFPSDGQIFQVVSGLLTAISGALMMRVKPPGTVEQPKSHPLPVPDAQSSTLTTTTKETISTDPSGDPGSKVVRG